jgi:hypothetical protein
MYNQILQGFHSSFQNYIVSYCPSIVAATVTLGVSQPSPLTEISSQDLEGVAAPTETMNNYTIPHYGKTVWMARTEEVLAFPSCFFFRVIAQLYLEELDCFMPRDTIFLIQDLDRVLGV